MWKDSTFCAPCADWKTLETQASGTLLPDGWGAGHIRELRLRMDDARSAWFWLSPRGLHLALDDRLTDRHRATIRRLAMEALVGGTLIWAIHGMAEGVVSTG